MTREILLGATIIGEIALGAWNMSLEYQLQTSKRQNIALVQQLSQRTSTLQTRSVETNARIDEVLTIPAIAQSKKAKELQECMADFNKYFRTQYYQDAQQQCENPTPDGMRTGGGP